MMKRFVAAILIFVPALAGATQTRGNLNLSYQSSENGTSNSSLSSFHQILNVYLYDRLFYSNDLTLGAYVFHSKASNRDRGDFRIRYSAGLIGNRYNFYTTFSPYTTYQQFGPSEKTRVFVGSLSLTPKYLPAINSSYNSTRKFTTDDPPSRSGMNYSWNVGTQVAKSFGSFRGVYQRQRGKVYSPIPQNQTQQTVNFAYDMARQMPLKITSSASYSFTGNRLDLPPSVTDYTRTHNGAAQVGRRFGPWFSMSAASSGRFSEYERNDQINELQDFLANGAANLNLRQNLSVMMIRGYSSSENRNDTTSRVVNDYVSLSGQYAFGDGPGNGGRLSVSRGLYLESAIGRANVTNAAALFDLKPYRDIDASINLGMAHNDRVSSNQGKFSMTRTIDLVARPMRLMTLNLTYNSSMVSNNINFADYTSDNMSASLNHTLKWYFNYTATFTRSSFRAGRRNVVSSLALSANCRVSRSLSFLSTYARRDIGRADVTLSDDIDESIASQVSWLMSRRANLKVNHTVSGLGSASQSQSYGGNLLINF